LPSFVSAPYSRFGRAREPEILRRVLYLVKLISFSLLQRFGLRHRTSSDTFPLFFPCLLTTSFKSPPSGFEEEFFLVPCRANVVAFASSFIRDSSQTVCFLFLHFLMTELNYILFLSVCFVSSIFSLLLGARWRFPALVSLSPAAALSVRPRNKLILVTFLFR